MASTPASCAPTSRYSRLSIALHWLMVLLLAATAITMEVRGMYPKGSDAREWIKSVHYVLGLSVLALVWLRLLARFNSQTPPIQPTPPTWQTGLSHAAHAALYLLMLGLPIVGWLALSASGKPIAWPWGGALPLWPMQDRALAHTLKELHEAGAVAGYGLVTLHAVAGLAHHYLWRDNTLLRMLPGKS